MEIKGETVPGYAFSVEEYLLAIAREYPHLDIEIVNFLDSRDHLQIRIDGEIVRVISRLLVHASDSLKMIEKEVHSAVREYQNRKHELTIAGVPTVMPGIKVANGASCYTLRCSCRAGMACEKISEVYLSEKDDAIYWSAPVRSDLKRGLRAYFAVQVYKCIFHPVEILEREIESWDDSEVNPMLIYRGGGPYPDLLVPLGTSMSVMYEMLHTVTMDDGELDAYRQVMREFKAGAPLGGLCKNHNLGANKRLANWLHDARNPEDVVRKELANLFTLYNFELCYVCYQSKATLFDMIELF